MTTFAEAFTANDADALSSLLAEDVRFSSPASHRQYVGRSTVLPMLLAARRALEDFRYVDELSAPNRHVLEFVALVGDRQLQGVDLVSFADDGRVTELTVMIRPLSGLQAVTEAVGRSLSAGPPAAIVDGH